MILLKMHKYLSSSLNSIVSIDLETSWAAKSLQEALQQARFDVSNKTLKTYFAELFILPSLDNFKYSFYTLLCIFCAFQARFQQKQIQEREEKLLRLYENQQQRAFERVGRGSAGSNTSLGSTGGGGKVRQMFDERRQKAGVDRSYPLEPLKGSKSNGQTRGASTERVKNSTSRTVVKSTVQKSVSQVRNGKPVVSKREVVHSVYNNNDGDETFQEHKFETDNLNQTFNKTHADIIELMNNHNLNDSLDNEEMPEIGFDEPDEPCFTGKLANLGGKLPSESVAVVNEKKTPPQKARTLGKTFRKDTKVGKIAKMCKLSNSMCE